MKNNLTLLLIFLAWPSINLAQDSNIPASVRAMLERSQAANQYEQTARVQMSVQFGEFLEIMASEPQKQAEVETVLIEILSQRAELSAKVSAGQTGTAELARISDYDYLRERLLPLLNSADLALLDNQRGGPTEEQLKKDYAAALSRTAPDLSAETHDLVLDTLIQHIRNGSGNAVGLTELSVDELVTQQSMSLMRAREELESKISREQMQQVYSFLNQLQSNLYRNRSMSDTAQ